MPDLSEDGQLLGGSGQDRLCREIKKGQVAFHFIDFQDEKNARYAKAYDISGPALIVAKIADNKVASYKDLDEIWTKVRDKAAFVQYVQENVKAGLDK